MDRPPEAGPRVGLPRRGAFRALVHVELRRAAAVARSSLIWSVVVVAVFAALGRASLRLAIYVPAFFAFSTALSVPLGTMRDKLDGSMEFLRTLPLPATTVVAARMCAGFVVLACASPLLTFAAVLVARNGGPVAEVEHLALGAFLLVALFGAALLSLASGVLLRLRQEHFGVLMVALLAGAAAAEEAVVRIVPDAGRRFEALVRTPDFPMIFSGTVLLVAVLAVALGFGLGVSGLRRYRPDRDRITW